MDKQYLPMQYGCAYFCLPISEKQRRNLSIFSKSKGEHRKTCKAGTGTQLVNKFLYLSSSLLHLDDAGEVPDVGLELQEFVPHLHRVLGAQAPRRQDSLKQNPKNGVVMFCPCFFVVQVTILKLGWRSRRANVPRCVHFPTDICSVIQEGEIAVEKCAHRGTLARREHHTLSLGRNKHGHNNSAPLKIGINRNANPAWFCKVSVRRNPTKKVQRK